MNGATGGMGMGGAQNMMPIAPPGHQADLNVILQYVEQLHEQLAANKAQTDRIVSSCGEIRQRAIAQQKQADEVIKAAAEDFEAKQKTLDEEARELRERLEKESHEHGEWKVLAQQYAQAMQGMLEQAHAFKVKSAGDMAAWHRSYRDQLAAEREENLKLRLQVGDMQAAAQRGNEYLESFLREWDGSERVMKMKEEVIYYRQTARAWKRTALKMLPDDDSEFSDNDDLIDPEEKKRRAILLEEQAKQRALLEDRQERGLDPKTGQPLRNTGPSQEYLMGAQGLGMSLGHMGGSNVTGNSSINALVANAAASAAANASARQTSTGIATQGHPDDSDEEDGEELEEFPRRDTKDNDDNSSTSSVLTDASIVSESEIVMRELMEKSGLFAQNDGGDDNKEEESPNTSQDENDGEREGRGETEIPESSVEDLEKSSRGIGGSLNKGKKKAGSRSSSKGKKGKGKAK